MRRVLWVAGITCVMLMATVECLYRAALTRLPVLPRDVSEAAIARVLAQAPGAEESSTMLHVRSLMPWTLLRVLTKVLRARKRPTSLLEGFALANHSARQWLHLLEPIAGLRACAACPSPTSAGGARRSCPCR